MIKKFVWICGILGVVIAVVLLFYLNSRFRVEYEHSIVLPKTAKIIEVKSEWWVPRSCNLGRENVCRILISTVDFVQFVASLENCHNCIPTEFVEGQVFLSLPLKFGEFREVVVERKVESNLEIKIRTVFND